MKLSDEIPKRVIDQSATTLIELMKETGYGRFWVADFAKHKVEDGEWESVFKRVNNRVVPAYRRKKRG